MPTNHFWGNDPLTINWNPSSYLSPLGCRVSYPKNLDSQPLRSNILFGEMQSESKKIAPPLMLIATQIATNDLDVLEKGLLEEFQSKPGVVIQQTQRLTQPRPAVMIDLEAATSREERFTQRVIAEAIDNGQICLMCVGTRLKESQNVPLMPFWESVTLPAQISSPGWRTYNHEPSGIAFEFPADWLIQQAVDNLVQMRSPVRHTKLHNIEVIFAPLAEGIETLTAHDPAADSHWAGLVNPSLISRNVDLIGNQPATRLEYTKLDLLGKTDYVWALFFATPRRLLVQMILSGDERRRDDYFPIFDHIQKSIRCVR